MNKITFNRPTIIDKDCLFAWFEKPHVKEFWNNSGNTHKNLENYLNRTKNLFDYWIGLLDEIPFCLLMTSDATDGPSDSYCRTLFAPHLLSNG